MARKNNRKTPFTIDTPKSNNSTAMRRKAKRPDTVPSRQEVETKLRAAGQKMIDNLIAAKGVAPSDLPEKDRRTLDQAIAKAERLIESIDEALTGKKDKTGGKPS